MASLPTELAEILHTVQRPGDFYTTGTTDIFAPRLEVAGVGPLALPQTVINWATTVCPCEGYNASGLDRAAKAQASHPGRQGRVAQRSAGSRWRLAVWSYLRLPRNESENRGPYILRQRGPGGDDRCQVGVHTWCTRQHRLILDQRWKRGGTCAAIPRARLASFGLILEQLGKHPYG